MAESYNIFAEGGTESYDIFSDDPAPVEDVLEDDKQSYSESQIESAYREGQESLTAFAQQLIALPVGGIVGLGKGLASPTKFGQKFTEGMEEMQELLVSAPESEEGKEALENLQAPFEFLEAEASASGMAVHDLLTEYANGTLAPEAATAVHTAVMMLPAIFGARGKGLPKKVEASAEGKAIQAELMPKETPPTGEIILGRDERPFKEFKESVVEISEKEVPMTTKPGTKIVKIVKATDVDMPMSAQSVFDPRKLIPGKFVGDKYPVVKKAVDIIDRLRITTDQMVEQLYFRPEVRQGYGRPHNVPTTEGGRTQWQQLTTKDQANWARVRAYYGKRGISKPSVEMLMRELKNKKGEVVKPALPKHAAEGYLSESRMVAQIPKLYNREGAKYGGEKFVPMKTKKGYSPHMWQGEFKVWVRAEGARTPMDAHRFKTKTMAKRFVADFNKKSKGDFKATLEKRKPATGEDAVEAAFNEAIVELRKSEDPNVTILEGVLAELRSKKGFGVHKREQAGTGGWLRDPKHAKSDRQLAKDYEKGIALYVEGGVRASLNMKAKKQLDQLFNDPEIAPKYPNSIAYAKTYTDAYFGKRTWLDKQLDTSVLGDYVTATQLGRAMSGMSTVTLYSKLFFHRLTFLYPQAIQPMQMIPAKMMHLRGLGINGNVPMAVMKSYKDLIKPGKEARYAERVFQREELITPKFIEQFNSNEWLKTVKSTRQFAADIVTGKWEVAKLEEYARLQAGLMFFNFLRSAKVPMKEAAHGASYLANKYMVEYHRAEKPLVFSGVIGKPMGSFKTFMMNYVAASIEYAKHAKNTGDAAPLLTLVATQLMVAGTRGMIGVVAVDNMLAALGFPTLTESMLEHEPDWVVFGPVQAATGLHIATLEAPGLNLTDVFSFPQLEYFGKSAKAIYDIAAAKYSGKLTELQYYNALQTMSPGGPFKAMIEQYFEAGTPLMSPDDDAVLIHDPKTGKGITRRNFSGYVARLAGARTLEETRAMKALFQMTRMQKQGAVTKKSLITWMAYLAINDIPFSMDIVTSEIKRLSEYQDPIKGKELSKAILREAVRMSTTALERVQMMKTKDGTAYQQLMAIVGEYEKEKETKDSNYDIFSEDKEYDIFADEE